MTEGQQQKALDAQAANKPKAAASATKRRLGDDDAEIPSAAKNARVATAAQKAQKQQNRWAE